MHSTPWRQSALCLCALAFAACASEPLDQRTVDGGPLDLPSAPAEDGAPIRQTCTNSFGHAISSSYGRLDGELVSIVPPGNRGCNGDTDHLHLQVRAGGAVYDIAITVIDLNGGLVDYLAIDHAALGDAFSEGWHANASLDYPTLGLHATDFTATAKATLTQTIQTELATANHVSIFATGYTDGTGAHKVHRNGSNMDGALEIHPLASVARVLFFHFETQSF